MLRLMPFYSHELNAMNDYFSKMAKKGWQYSWRWLCFIGFKKTENAECLKCVFVNYGDNKRVLRKYSGDLLDRNIALTTDETVLSKKEVQSEKTINRKTSDIVYTSVILAFFLAVAAFSWFPVIVHGLGAYYNLRLIISLIVFPVLIFLIIYLAFIVIRNIRISRSVKQKTEFKPFKRYIVYISLLCSVLLFSLQIVLCNIGMSEEQAAQYDSFVSVINKEIGSTKSPYLNNSRCILDPEFYGLRFFLGDGTVDISYYESLTGIGTNNYCKQFVAENQGVIVSVESDQDIRIYSAESGNYYAKACVIDNKIIVFSAYRLGDDTNIKVVNSLAEVFVSGHRG